MIETQPIPAAEYYVIFTQGVTHWITRYLRRNFSHIVLVTRDEYNWIILNPTRLYLQVIIPPVQIKDSPLPLCTQSGDSILHIKFKKRDDTQQFGSLGLLNCVTWSKYMLGLRIKCLTPFRLYQRLLNFNQSERERHGIISIEQVKL
jgi:hypothetical protein